MSDDDETICLACWRTEVSMTRDPPQREGWFERAVQLAGAPGRSKFRPIETASCAWCGRPANNGIYVPVKGFRL